MHSICIALLALVPAVLQETTQPLKLEKLGLTIATPPLTELTLDATVKGQVHGVWKGKWAGSRVEISVIVLPNSQFGFVEPEDVTEILLEYLRDDKQPGGDANFGWDSQELRPGKFGWTPYASIAVGSHKQGTETKSSVIMFSSLVKDAGYVVQVDAEPEFDAPATKAAVDWLVKGVVYTGETRSWKWTDADAKARWESDAAPETHKKYEGPLRTDHYLILTDSSGGKTFAKKMEECYAAIRKVYPFDEVAGRELMPVFLFRTPDEYYAFCQKVAGMSLEQARATKGHAWKDYYATWYEAPGDPVHIHEATHQIFANRLRLSGGGSWFQEGVAEYISSSENDRNMAAQAVRKERHTPLAEFVTTPSLIASGRKEDVTGGSAASNAYDQAALLIEFLRDSKWAKPKFQEFLHTVGLVPRGQLPAIQAAIRKVYGCDLDELEAKWVEYCKKR